MLSRAKNAGLKNKAPECRIGKREKMKSTELSHHKFFLKYIACLQVAQTALTVISGCQIVDTQKTGLHKAIHTISVVSARERLNGFQKR